MKILVVRNDKLGDFMLAYPAFAMLKSSLPQAQISALVPAYTAPMAELCPWIDHVLLDPGEGHWNELVIRLRGGHFDAVITLFSTGRIALACFTAGIPYRLAPATKLAQLFYTQRMTQRRSRSEKPEYEYNIDLVHRFLADHAIEPSPRHLPPFLRFPEGDVARLRREFCHSNDLNEASQLIILHPGSGGSAQSLRIEQFAALAQTLRSANQLTFIVGAGPTEDRVAELLAKALTPLPHAIYHSNTGIVDYARHIAFADLFISGSTGPLHIAGALNVPTAAFYTRRRSATPVRWQTLNSPDRHLAFMPPEHSDEMDMESIDIEAAAHVISAHFLN